MNDNRMKSIIRKANSDVAVFAGIFLVFIAAAYGWIMNLVAVFHAAEAGRALTVGLAIRVLAVFCWPLGCVLGWF